MNLKSKWVLGILMVSGVAVMNTEAQAVCHTMQKCREMQGAAQDWLDLIQDRMLELASGEVALGDFVLNKKGQFHIGTAHEARRTCESKGFRVPSARELALHAKSLGAQGIRETAYPNALATSDEVLEEIKKMESEGYSPIYTGDQAFRRKIDFYFSNVGYQAPAESVGPSWSSSKSFDDSDNYYYLVTATGQLLIGDVAFDLGIRCMESR